MSVWKRILLFLTVFVLVVGVVFLPFSEKVPSWISTVRNSWDDRPYQMAAYGADGVICAVRMEENSTLALRFFAPGDKKSRETWKTAMPEEAGTGEISILYPMGDQCAYVGMYEENAKYLSLYRVQKGQAVERLMREECTGDTVSSRRESLFFSSATRQQENVTFVLMSKEIARLVTCNQEEGIAGVTQTERGNSLSAVGVSGFLYEGEDTEIALTFMGSGIFYMNGKNMSVYYSDLKAETAAKELLKLDGLIGDEQLTSISLMRDGGALLLLDGHILRQVHENGEENITNQLFPDRGACIIRIAALLVASVIISLILWWVMVGLMHGRLPLAVYWGVVVVALFAVGANLFCHGVLGPAEEKADLERKAEYARSVIDLALVDYKLQDSAMPNLVARSMGSGEDGEIRDLQVVPIHWKDGNWYLSSGVRAELSPGVHSGFLKQAEDEESASGKAAGKFWYCRTQGQNGLMLSFKYDQTPGLSSKQHFAVIGLGILAAVMLVILGLIGRDVRKTARGLECYAGDQKWTRVHVSGGDELEGMASTLNSLAAERREQERMRERIVASYRRFVPEQILNLLGKRSVLDVDKNTLVSRRMSVMRVAFFFPEPVYTNAANTRLLFDSVNQVIEQTASIVRQKGGAVFNFSYNGYDVVMEQDVRQIVSAAVAVQQEVLAINERRAQDALPTVTLQIAVDVGEVIMGIVGDQDQIEPATLSDSFATLRELIQICGQIGASVLCTEPIISGADGYGSRYVGRCNVGRNTVRVYEIFDGDPYDIRKGKAAGIRRFTEGVLSLYGGEIAQAKRIFLELVRDTPQDGGARYYLYLADKLTKGGALHGLSLNGRMEIDDDTE